jgi:hypothetical protein
MSPESFGASMTKSVVKPMIPVRLWRTQQLVPRSQITIHDRN